MYLGETSGHFNQDIAFCGHKLLYRPKQNLFTQTALVGQVICSYYHCYELVFQLFLICCPPCALMNCCVELSDANGNTGGWIWATGADHPWQLLSYHGDSFHCCLAFLDEEKLRCSLSTCWMSQGASCTLLVSHLPAAGMLDWNWAGEMKHPSTSREGKMTAQAHSWGKATLPTSPKHQSDIQMRRQQCQACWTVSLKRDMVDTSFLLEHPSDNAGTSNRWLPRTKMSSVECHYAEDQMLQFFLLWCSCSLAWRDLSM